MSRPFVSDRYLVCDAIGSGGMATVHLGRAFGTGGFSRIVAIKRIQSGLGDDAAEMATMLLDEARLASRIRHPNVVAALDVVRSDGSLLFVMEYVHGAPLSWILRRLAHRGERIPLPIVARIAQDILAGLHAAHEAKSERGRPLELVHRDISPQNILVGDDGHARIADFGIAKANGKLNQTRTGVLRGKLKYMAPEQFRSDTLDRRVDLYATGLVLWELLTLRRLREQEPAAERAENAIEDVFDVTSLPPSRFASVPPELDDVVMTALRPDASERFQNAHEMAKAVEAACRAATATEVADWVREVAAELLDERAALVAHVEEQSAQFEQTEYAKPQQDASADVAASSAKATVAAPASIHVPADASADRAPPRHRSTRFVVPVLAGALVVLGAIVLFSAVRRTAGPPATSRAEPSFEAAAAAPPDAAAGTTVASEPPRVPTMTAGTVPRPNVTSVPPSSRGRKVHAPKHVPKSCDPPYRVDELGVRVPRRECFD